ncbi:CTP synthase isoform X2 [Musca autumnalis]|uniref:CTP synthase isoform X2 n=1 Tax=Musca autumnalis TaxID=221902 RepID=UPI003CF5A566
MAPKKSTIVLNVEQFIRDVEQRPAIWNRNFHCNKAFLEQMWDELSSEHKLPKVVLKAKWKGLRDNFRVEYKRIPRADNGDFLVEPATFESKWIHYYALLFLTEHMRHRVPKNEQDQAFFFAQQSQDCEKTVVEPDLTNGLIRRIQDSDEEFDEDDVEEDDDEVTETTPPAAHSQPLTSVVNTVPGAIIKIEDSRKNFDKEVQDLSKKSLDNAATNLTQASISNNNSNTGIATPLLMATTAATTQQQQQQATTISSTTAVSPMALGLCLTQPTTPPTTIAGTTTAAALTAPAPPIPVAASSPLSLQTVPASSSSAAVAAAASSSSLSSCSVSSVSSTTSNSPPSSSASASLTALNLFQGTPPVAHTTAFAVAATLASMNNAAAAAAVNGGLASHNPLPSVLPLSLTTNLPSALVLPNTCLAPAGGGGQQKIRSVSPPPLYNKAHHPPPSSNNNAAIAMSKERSDDFPLNVANCLHGSHENLNFTKYSYTNGLIPALKLKRPRLSEDSNFNGSSSMDTSTATPTPLVPEDDDYHYLLSLHPYMKQLTAAQKLRIRTKIQKLIFKELYKEDLEESK